MITAEWISVNIPGLSSVIAYPSGGQKWVFSATHEEDGDVVIKIIKPHADLERINREILAVQTINSPRVPEILHVGELEDDQLDGKLIYIRERRIRGDNVRETLADSVFNRDDILHLGLHILEALADGEKERIVHRDVKPENIIRCVDGSYWLLDFGIARHLNLTSCTASDALFGPGTVGYAPPEQFLNRKHEIDGRTDLFALAVTFVECITGINPFKDGARDVPEILRRVENEPLVIPTIYWDIDNKLRDLIACMGQRRIDCRPSDVDEALTWIKEIYAAYNN